MDFKNEILQILERKRVILHIDLDAFYCQVEHVRLGVPLTTPLCVQQWNGLIAVNYAAREFGIKRHCTPDEAKKKCPNLLLIHCASYAQGDTEFQYHSNPNYKTHKISLDPYRKASQEIFKIFKRFDCILERDEAYLDISNIVNNRILENRELIINSDSTGPKVGWVLKNQVLIGEDDITTNGWSDYQLLLGSEICTEIRNLVFAELSYTCSAGIAHNKTLSKICSAMNKPNNQTVLRDSQVLEFMRTLDVNKIRNLGGKFGDQVEKSLVVEKAGDLWHFPITTLQEMFGSESANWLYNICRGICTENSLSILTIVQERNKAKSMGACKNFRPKISQMTEIRHWVSVLSTELFNRVKDDYETNERWPKNLTININQSTRKSKSTNMLTLHQTNSPDDIYNKAWGTITDGFMIKGTLEPLSGISLFLSVFQPNQLTGPIEKFFSKSETIPTFEETNLFFSINNKKTDSKQIKSDIFKEADNSSKRKLESIEGVSYICEKCNKLVLYEELFDHQDLHFAMDLEKQENFLKREISGIKEVKIIKKAKNKPVNSKTQNISNYFTTNNSSNSN